MYKILIIACLLGMGAGVSAQALKSVSYNDGTQKLHGLVTATKGASRPGVLILPAWKGIDQEAKDAAIALEKEGYIAFIADIYGEGNTPKDNAAAGKIAGKYKTDYAAYQHRIQLALEELKKAGADADNLAVIGYCFGGTGALEAARGNFPVKGVVSIHGGLAKDQARPNTPIRAKILVENPAEDKGVTPAILEALTTELKEGKADWQLITYANSGHTFTDPASPEYNKLMADRAWQHTLLFLAEILK
ncbi:dienelactone hydrolase family protein [Sphingobacterium bambusae]|uniref:Dienelactone hydrolase family protein n=1 Tax=Sphingobacterium bambusae TaxID=662858 RepID=A0ABW6BHF0_9SPHI|nr:dienelactone hydrolase family protein [Sphingobacterium bambusae]WPL50545.1 dienelactone hydrolase family protein [Sphingobacterium bambusae]